MWRFGALGLVLSSTACAELHGLEGQSVPIARETGSHACELKPLAETRPQRALSGAVVQQVHLPEIPFLGVLTVAAVPADGEAPMSWQAVETFEQQPPELCGYISITRPDPASANEDLTAHTGLRARRDLAYDPTALAFLFEAVSAEQFVEIPEGVYVAVEAPDGGGLDLERATAAAREFGTVDTSRWTITLSSRMILVPIDASIANAWRSAIPVERGARPGVPLAEPPQFAEGPVQGEELASGPPPLEAQAATLVAPLPTEFRE